MGQAPRVISVLPQSVGAEEGPGKWYGGVFTPQLSVVSVFTQLLMGLLGFYQ